MYRTLVTELSGHIYIITVNRPEKLNALNQSVLDELREAIEEVYQNREIRAAIITGAGSKSFVAGADIGEFQGLTKAQALALSKKGQDIFFKIENSPKPIVAAVNGFALGGGCELAIACHFRVCSENAKFGQPEVNLGLIPGYGGTQRLTQLVGKGNAMELMMSGSMVDAQGAQRIGLVNHVTSEETLMAKTKEILQSIVSKAPIALAKVIECVNVAVVSDSSYNNGKSGFEKEQQAFGECFDTQDAAEGVQAFLAKRKPQFAGH